MPATNRFSILPIILCGGSGTRLWPLSRKSYPKQFVPLLGDQSLLGLTLQRLSHLSSTVGCVASEDHRFLVAEEMRQAGLSLGNSNALFKPDGPRVNPTPPLGPGPAHLSTA